MSRENDFNLIKLPSVWRMSTLAFVTLVIMSLFAPVQGLGVLRNELGAFAGTACLLLFVDWWLKKDALGFSSLLSEGAEIKLSHRIKRVLKLFLLYLVTIISLCYFAYGVFFVLDHFSRGALLKVSSFDLWLTAGESQKSQRTIDLFKPAPVWWLFWSVCMAPFLEELFFRRFLYSALRRKHGVVLSIIVTSVLFGFIHAPIPLLMAVTIVLGGFLGYLYEKQKDFCANVFFHALNNVFALFVFWAIGSK